MFSNHVSLILILVCTSTSILSVSSEYRLQATSPSSKSCMDRPNEKFVQQMKGKKGKKVPIYRECEWLKRQKKITVKKVCLKSNPKGSAKEVCPFTCNVCGDYSGVEQSASQRLLHSPRKLKKSQISSNKPSTSFRPSNIPSISPYPTFEPSANPSMSAHPSLRPSNKPSVSPYPTFEPSSNPSESAHPSLQPLNTPSMSPYPTFEPSSNPSESAHPSLQPSITPSMSPYPTFEPSSNPSKSAHPSLQPSITPSMSTYPTFEPSSGPSFQPSRSSAPTIQLLKRGMILGHQAIEASAQKFSDSVSWFYNYKQDMYGDWQGRWADENNIEFVPMISQPWLNIPGTDEKLCYFEDFYGLTPVCTTQDVIDTLQNSVSARTVRPSYLLGFNEQYNNPPPEGRDISPAQAAHYWGKYVQPGAIAAELDLVSPSSNNGNSAVKWLADFLKSCYDKRNDEHNYCDIELIAKIAVHGYDCRESFWDEAYNGENSLFYQRMGRELGTYGGKLDWMDYLLTRPLWVTETNCYWEQFFEGVPHHSSKKQCLRISGQLPDTHGVGSLIFMENMDNFERYAWWTTWNVQPKPNYLTYLDGGFTPIGKAYLNPGDPSADCEYTGEKIMADEAELTGKAWIGTCPTTGTKIAQWIGVDGSTGTFTVEVPIAGDYAVNISYIAAVDLDMTVRVNDGEEKIFYFILSGRWCYEGNTHPDGNGEPTVVPMELQGFKAGTNILHLSQGTTPQAPVIEWIAVVPKEELSIA